MNVLINIQDDIIRLANVKVLERLLVDKSTGKNIMWGTDAYSSFGKAFDRREEIKPHLISGANIGLIKTRARKAFEQQSARTKQHAEVFTPLWVCKKMIDHADEVWFGRAGAFDNAEEKVVIPKKKKWQHYVDQRRLEITCGEAPFLVSRYDVASAEVIPIEKRIGILDRKLRIVNENTETEEEWIEWAFRAFESTYGYEFQGDNLLIARVNFMMSFVEYLGQRWHREPTEKEYQMIANRISWNLWQMDGLSGTIPYCQAEEEFTQFDMFGDMGIELDSPEQQPLCKIYDWRRENSLAYKNVNKGGRNMKFDFIIGNPPYQEEVENNGRSNPIYNLFMDSVYKIADCVELITPARFLFNAGQTPKAWNNKMLTDEHLKILFYESDGSKVFANTDIKGGVAISYRNTNKVIGPIGTFTSYPEINNVLRRVSVSHKGENIMSIISNRGMYRFSDSFFHDNPTVRGRLAAGSGNMLTSKIFDVIPECFVQEPNGEDCIAFYGRIGSNRVYRYIKRKYIIPNDYIDTYNVFVTEANGSGAFGEVLSTPIIGAPTIAHTDTFLSIGRFHSADEAASCLKYIKTKFARSMLGTLKVTQHNPPATWKHVPLQDFTPESDIDWSKSIPEIDKQLYAKYGLSQEEIDFIETHVKEMS